MASRLQSIVLTLVLLLAINTSAGAWGDTGHMVVAQIAFNNLDGQRRARVTQLAQKVQLGNRTYDFVTLACWMDDTRDFPMFEPLKDWHFLDKRIIVSGPAQEQPPPTVNVQSILEWAIDKLDNPTITDSAKAFALAYLVHLAGDVHQPLHCATRYTTDHPNGDRGGNLFLLNNAQRPNL
ncbi:MAG TPA: S1/P1 nuclease, partial [Blastocatellia bacterium]|nr:S1/P1 nuclease [Blastocatellia bacterium]